MVEIRKTRNVWLLIIILGFIGLCRWVGCSGPVIKQDKTASKIWSCDKDADRAFHQQLYRTSILLHERFLEKEPFNGLALYHIGYTYGKMGDHGKEVFYYEEAIKLGFYQDNIFFNLGMAFGELNQIEKSIMAFKRALDIDSNNPDNHFGLAMAYHKNTSYILAKDEFLKVIELDPKNMDARLYLARLYLEMNDWQKARDQLQNILDLDPAHDTTRDLFQSIEKMLKKDSE